MLPRQYYYMVNEAIIPSMYVFNFSLTDSNFTNQPLFCPCMALIKTPFFIFIYSSASSASKMDKNVFGFCAPEKDCLSWSSSSSSLLLMIKWGTPEIW
mmetsp:Transcript_12365/g.18125  ORF Transcript_12365/g.18125 Transcript_12365/m.18125 type:complete len:98 (-) Transcript_12365:455-748(-)